MNGGSQFILRMRHWMAAFGFARKNATAATNAIEPHPAAHDASGAEIKLLERNIVDLPERNPHSHSRN